MKRWSLLPDIILHKLIESFSILFLYPVMEMSSVFVSCCWIDTITRLTVLSHASILSVKHFMAITPIIVSEISLGPNGGPTGQFPFLELQYTTCVDKNTQKHKCSRW